MCDTCGCNITDGNRHLVSPGGRLEQTADGRSAVTVLKSLLDENDHQALHNRAHFDARGILAVNLMSSPGSGKTALLEATIDALVDPSRMVVIEGDLETENDAARIRARGVEAIQVATGSACHLDAHMVHSALHRLNLDDVDLVFIENVGNLVCPASFDLGQHLNVTLLSVTEGDDKPAKYPVMFRAADLMLLTKTDLLAVLDDFDPLEAERALRLIGSAAPVLHASPRKGAGIDQWIAWVEAELVAQRARIAAGTTRRPAVQAEGTRLHAVHPAHGGHGHSHDHEHTHVNVHEGAAKA
ncbi:MAG TPA: hydrogenase nickel incorporation protein HypB [Gammaproteobacteria bacterium]|nr:hydrogenase nickel incorporation protein HypB [Gammaproteobacteria bacterium]